MPFLHQWCRNGMPVLRHCMPKHKLSNAKYTLDVLEAAWVLEQCKVEGGLSTVPALLAALYCLACKIVPSLFAGLKGTWQSSASQNVIELPCRFSASAKWQRTGMGVLSHFALKLCIEERIQSILLLY